MVRCEELGQDTMIPYRIQAHKKTGLIVGRSGSMLARSGPSKRWAQAVPDLHRPILVGTSFSGLSLNATFCGVNTASGESATATKSCSGPWATFEAAARAVCCLATRGN